MPMPEQPRPTISAAASQMVAPKGLESEATINGEPNYPFLLRHHGRTWHVESEGLDGPTLLPEIVHHILMPGCNGIRTRNKGEAVERSYEDAVAAAKAKGWHYIPLAPITDRNHLPDGIPAGPPVRSLLARHPLTGNVSPVYLEAWQVPIETLPDEPQQYRFDRASYNRWRKHLVETGVIPPALASVKTAIRKRAAGHVANIQGRTATDPQVKAANLERANERLDAANEAQVPKPVVPSAMADEVAELRRELAERDAELGRLKAKPAGPKSGGKPKAPKPAPEPVNDGGAP